MSIMLPQLFILLALTFVFNNAQPLSEETCRFGTFDFGPLTTSLVTGDLLFTSSTGLTYFLNPCGRNNQPNCFAADPERSPSMCSCNVIISGFPTICSPLSTSVIITDRAPLDSTDPIDTPAWSFIGGSASNGVQYSLSNGQTCPSNTNVRITTIVQFVCGTPFSSFESVTLSGCTYTAVIRTSLACVSTPSSTGLPAPSSTSMAITSVSSSSSSGPLIIGDPQFVGLRGQSYQVHGIDGEIYNLVSSATTQINAKFVFLNDGSCPIINSIVQTNCWSHPGSYLGEIGVQQVVGDHINTLHVIAGSAKQGFAAVLVNNGTMKVGDVFSDSDSFSMSFETTHRVRCRTEEFEFVFDSSDKFINQGLTMRLPIKKITAHGLIGQTHQSMLYATPLKYIAGEVDDYLIEERDIWGTGFLFNQFTHS